MGALWEDAGIPASAAKRWEKAAGEGMTADNAVALESAALEMWQEFSAEKDADIIDLMGIDEEDARDVVDTLTRRFDLARARDARDLLHDIRYRGLYEGAGVVDVLEILAGEAGR